LPPTYLFMALAAQAGLHLFAPGPRLLTWPWRAAGIVLLAAGVGLNLSADRALKRVRTTVRPDEPVGALVDRGAYRVSRHPMYLGFVLLAAGVAMLLGTSTPWLAVAGLALVLEFAFIRPEERAMDAAFGEQWRAYRARVRRWV